jgi:hypothetical protein
MSLHTHLRRIQDYTTLHNRRAIPSLFFCKPLYAVPTTKSLHYPWHSACRSNRNRNRNCNRNRNPPLYAVPTTKSLYYPWHSAYRSKYVGSTMRNEDDLYGKSQKYATSSIQNAWKRQVLCKRSLYYSPLLQRF